MCELQLTKSKQQMKNEKATVAPRLAAGIINKVMFVMVACLLARPGFAGAQPAPERLPGPDNSLVAATTNAAPAADTNSPVGSIAANLRAAAGANQHGGDGDEQRRGLKPALQAAKVTKLADEITELGTKDLGMEGKSSSRRKRSSPSSTSRSPRPAEAPQTPAWGPSARDIYGTLLPGLEAELAKLMDAKLTAVRIRSEAAPAGRRVASVSRRHWFR